MEYEIVTQSIKVFEFTSVSNKQFYFVIYG
jgi:hypothetical protein